MLIYRLESAPPGDKSGAGNRRDAATSCSPTWYSANLLPLFFTKDKSRGEMRPPPLSAPKPAARSGRAYSDRR